MTLRGTWNNAPREGEHVWAIVQRGDTWWPQGEISCDPASEKEWSARINIGGTGKHTVLVGRINPLGKVLFDYYRHIIDVHKEWEAKLQQDDHPRKLPGTQWIGIKVQGAEPPKGIDTEDAVTFDITALTPLPAAAPSGGQAQAAAGNQVQVAPVNPVASSAGSGNSAGAANQ